MSIADKLTTVAENQQRVYDAGFNDGKAQGGDTETAYQEGVDNTFELVENTLSCGFLNYSYMFYKGSTTHDAKQIPPELLRNTRNGLNFSYMFYYCNILKSIPFFDTSKGINMACMFYNCFSLTEIPPLDTSKNTNFSSMFYGCSSLTKVPPIDASSATKLYYTFLGCSALTEIQITGTSKVTDFGSAFYNCKALKTITELDLTSAAIVSNTFGNCNELENITFKGIIAKTGLSFQNSSKLTHDSLMSIINALKDYSTSSSTYKITLGTTNLAKLTDEEKAMITAKGWTYA